MTLREVQALLLLYRACADEAVRRRVLALLPELGDLVGEIEVPQIEHRVVETINTPWAGIDSVSLRCSCGITINGGDLLKAREGFFQYVQDR